MRRSFVLLGCALLVGCASGPRPTPTTASPEPAVTAGASRAAAAPERPPYLSPAEVMKRLEASKVAYDIDGMDSPPGGWADTLWPQRVEPNQSPRVVEQGGQRVIQTWPVNQRAEALLQEAEPHFQAERYAEAAALYAQATELCPDCYVAWVFRGDAAWFSGDAATALEHYRKAIALNPDDHRTWFYLGKALLKLERFDEALDAWAWCLVLNPRYPALRQFLRVNDHLGLVIREDAIVPRGYAERTAKGVSIRFDPNHDPAWLAFANCKALWLGEPSHRQEMTGTTDEHFSSVEELECLGSALMVHQGEQKDGKTDQLDPTLSRLLVIAQDGMLGEAIIFEVGARIHPQVVLTLDDAVRQRLKDYVLKHVLVPVGGPGAAVDL